MRHRLPTGLHAIGLVVLIALVLPFLLFAVPQLIGASQSYVVLSDSMSPSINAGDVVLVAETDPGTIDDGDVITYEGQGGTLTTHRVVNITRQDGNVRFRTKGDANEDVDPGFRTPQQIVGVVTLTIPAIGYAINYINTDLGMFMMVILPGFLFICNEVYEQVFDQATGDNDSENSP